VKKKTSTTQPNNTQKHAQNQNSSQNTTRKVTNQKQSQLHKTKTKPWPSLHIT